MPALPVPAGADLRVPGLSPFLTPDRDFYRVDTALVVPRVNADTWRLRIHGEGVARPLDLDLRELLDRPLVEHDITLTCVSNEVGGPYAGNARWLGVRLADLLREAGVRPPSQGGPADQLVARSVDGMTIGTPVEAVMDGRAALLAVGMNGEPLPFAHGFPVRMVVPGLYGYVSACKWLTELRLTTFAAYDAYWVRRSWAQQAPVKTQSRIDTPRPYSRPDAGPGGGRRGGVGAAPRDRGGRGTRGQPAPGSRRGSGPRTGSTPGGSGCGRGRRPPDGTRWRSVRRTARAPSRPGSAPEPCRTGRPGGTRWRYRSKPSAERPRLHVHGTIRPSFGC